MYLILTLSTQFLIENSLSAEPATIIKNLRSNQFTTSKKLVWLKQHDYFSCFDFAL